MGAMQRRKGKRFEREVAIELRKVYGEGVKRTLLAQARDGTEASDLDGTPWAVECKAHRVVNIKAAYEQACAAGKVSGKPPLVISKSNRGPVLVTLGLADFLTLVAQVTPLVRVGATDCPPDVEAALRTDPSLGAR